MAGLISSKDAEVLSSPDEFSAIDPKFLRSFYATSDDIVDDHFSQALQDDLHSLGADSASDDDWGW